MGQERTEVHHGYRENGAVILLQGMFFKPQRCIAGAFLLPIFYTENSEKLDFENIGTTSGGRVISAI